MIKYTIWEIIAWAPSFFLLETVTQKRCFSCFIWVFKVSLRLTLIQKGGFCSLRFLPLMTEFSVFMPLQGIAPGNSWLGDVKDYKVIWKIKWGKCKQNNTWRYVDFSTNNFISRMLYYLFFQGLEGHRFLDVHAKSLV